MQTPPPGTWQVRTWRLVDTTFSLVDACRIRADAPTRTRCAPLCRAAEAPHVGQKYVCPPFVGVSGGGVCIYLPVSGQSHSNRRRPGRQPSKTMGWGRLQIWGHEPNSLAEVHVRVGVRHHSGDQLQRTSASTHVSLSTHQLQRTSRSALSTARATPQAAR